MICVLVGIFDIFDPFALGTGGQMRSPRRDSETAARRDHSLPDGRL